MGLIKKLKERVKRIVAKHTHKQTITFEIIVPEHVEREESGLFRKTHKKLINKDSRCWVCGGTREEVGPLELHHKYISWAHMNNRIDWNKVKEDCPEFPYWSTFDPANPESFIDSEWNSCMVLCKQDHTGKNSGIHCLPYPEFILQRYLAEGEEFSPTETIKHYDEEDKS